MHVAAATGRRNLRQTEIENLGVPMLGDKDVGGLDIAVNNSGGMRRVQSIGDFRGKGEQSFVRQRPTSSLIVLPSRYSMTM